MRTLKLIRLVVWLLVSGLAAEAGAGENRRAAMLTWENDSLVRSGDSGYTQGIKLSLVGREYANSNRLDTSLARLAWGLETTVRRFGIAIGQTMFTPSDLSRSDLISDDRPYAGWLYLGLLYRRSGYFPADHSERFPILESFELDMGVVGPYSQADDMQKFVHRLGGWHKPRGWDNQLANEPGVVLDYVRLQVFPVQFYRLRFDLIPTLGLSAGNIAAHADLGVFVRLAFNSPKGVIHLPSGTSITTPVAIREDEAPAARLRGIGGYFFAGVEARALLYNTFLDGNISRDSHDVDKRTFVGDFKAGLALIRDRWEVSYTYVYRTKEFYGQPDRKSFGSISLTHYF